MYSIHFFEHALMQAIYLGLDLLWNCINLHDAYWMPFAYAAEQYM